MDLFFLILMTNQLPSHANVQVFAITDSHLFKFFKFIHCVYLVYGTVVKIAITVA